MTYPACPLVYEITFFGTPDGGPIHAVAKAAGASWARALTLCGVPLDGLQKQGHWELLREKMPGVPANPFFSARGCEGCGQRLKF